MPEVQLIAWTHFQPPAGVPWDTDADGGQALAEFAGRACYQSWTKPNPRTATNAGYLRHILDVGHLSVLEHGTATFYLTDVSRSFTHELIRHRHLSYSQLSQRYVEDSSTVVEPAVIADNPALHQIFDKAIRTASAAYADLVKGLDELLKSQIRCRLCTHSARYVEDTREGWWCAFCLRYLTSAEVMSPTARRKAVRQAARSVLPNATETRIVVTGNYRAWRHFIDMRGTENADVEIRDVALEILRHLQKTAPNVFGDYEIITMDDGTQVARSPHTS